jgi:hypothetical protein
MVCDFGVVNVGARRVVAFPAVGAYWSLANALNWSAKKPTAESAIVFPTLIAFSDFHFVTSVTASVWEDVPPWPLARLAKTGHARLALDALYTILKNPQAVKY